MGSGLRRRCRSSRASPKRSTESVQAVPLRAASGDGVWLLYGARVESAASAFDSRFEMRLARTSPDSVSAPVDLSAGVSSVVARYAGAWSGGALWVVDEIERRIPPETGPPRSVLRVRQLAPDQLPDRVPAPALPQRPRRPINPKLALDRAPGPRVTLHHGGGTWQAFFGNLHLHSDLSGDLRGFEGRPEDNLQVLEDLPRLDFGALSDHAETLRPVDWWATRKLTELWNRPGAFVTFPGYEWTSLDYGHRVVLFPDEQVGDRDALLAAAPGDPPTRLWSFLQGRAALTIPHHPSHALMRPVDWSFRNDHFQRLVEIFQVRGSYEFDGAPLNQKVRSDFVPGHSVRDALAMGHRLGIIASPDHGGGLGLAGAWARELTREALFEALYARRTFGTTGAKLELFLTVAGAPQGSELRRGAGSVPIEATVRGNRSRARAHDRARRCGGGAPQLPGSTGALELDRRGSAPGSPLLLPAGASVGWTPGLDEPGLARPLITRAGSRAPPAPAHGGLELRQRRRLANGPEAGREFAGSSAACSGSAAARLTRSLASAPRSNSSRSPPSCRIELPAPAQHRPLRVCLPLGCRSLLRRGSRSGQAAPGSLHNGVRSRPETESAASAPSSPAASAPGRRATRARRLRGRAGFRVPPGSAARGASPDTGPAVEHVAVVEELLPVIGRHDHERVLERAAFASSTKRFSSA